jgi:methyltransferase family protein
MGSVLENLATWRGYDWSQAGDEWSNLWGGTAFAWWGTIYPRIQAFVPTDVVLEIAPGFGRCTQYLKDIAQHLAIVDLTEVCIEACQQRFADQPHISYAVNDGKSLAMIPDNSVDFVFSFDSLVHAESDVLEAYLIQLGAKLKPDGVGFIHHSNLGAFLDPVTGVLPFENLHWRAPSMTAVLFANYCRQANLQCVGQELINWGGGELIDCFSVFVRNTSPLARPTVVIENRGFMNQIYQYGMIAPIYHPQHFQRPAPKVPQVSLLQKAKIALRRSGVRGLAIEILRYLTWRLEQRPSRAE